MDIAIVGRHTKVSDDMRERIVSKMAKVEALAPKATKAEIHVVHERNPRLSTDAERVEITVHDRGVIRVEASAEDRVAALELAATRILERLRRLHERKAHRHHARVSLPEAEPGAAAAVSAPVLDPAPVSLEPVESVDPWEGAPISATREIPLDGTPIVIRSKVHAASPMSVPDAIDQMELVGHDFFLFLDAESGLPSAVYRRRGWTYGVIHLDPAASEPERVTA